MPARFAFLAAATLLALPASLSAAFPAPQDSADPPGGRFDPPTRRVVVPDDVLAGNRVPLLRQGRLFVKVPGSIRRDERLGVLVFQPAVTSTAGVKRELILLPSRGLDDLDRLERTLDPQADAPSSYEVSGRILVYRGRNFILPESIFPIDRISDEADPEPTPPPATAEDPASPPTDEELDRIGDDLERRLESRIGAVPRSLDVLDAPPVERGVIPTGTRFVDRRGRLSRDPASGVWRFVLAGGGKGGAAPSVVLLPCLELERIERQARQRDIGRPLLLSGIVTSFRGRSYLLPTIARPATEGRGLGY